MNNVDENSQGHLYVLSPRGYSAYEVAVQNGFVGTEEEWLESLVGPEGAEGKSAYEVAVENGYIGTQQDWVNDFLTPDGYYNKVETDNKLKVKPYYYDTVADMKAATNLKDGDMVITLGFHEPKDGGAATYIITNTSSIIEYQEELTNGLYATLMIKDYVTPEQFGAYGDGTHDDYNALQNALDNCKIVKLLNKTYKTSAYIKLNNNNTLMGTSKLSTLYNISNNPCIRALSKEKITIKNLTIIDKEDHTTSNNGIYVSGENIIIDDVIIDSVGGDGIALGTSKHVKVTNTNILNSGLIAILAFEGDDVTFRNLYIKGAGHKYTCQFKSCINSTMDNIVIKEGTEISCLSTRQALQENPDSIMPKNITIKNIKIIDHSKGWTPQDANLVACLFEGEDYYISDIEIINSYTGGIKIELNNSIVENISIDTYGLATGNHIGAVFTDATDYGNNNIVKNVFMRNGTYQGIRSNLTNSLITGINIIDCGTSSNVQFASADKNSIINNVVLTTKSVDCRGLGFAFSSKVSSNSSYTNIKRIKASGHTSYDISGSSLPSDIYIKCEDAVRFNGGRGNLIAPFEYNKGVVTIYNLTGTTGITPTAGDVVVYNVATKTSTGYDRAYYNGSSWVNIIPLT